MRVLVIGGRVFLGRSIVTHLLNEGHDVTMFNRGQSHPSLFSDVPGIKFIEGDRNKDFDLFKNWKGKGWDAVIDTCGYFPESVGKMARELAAVSDHYVFISTGSVYFQEDANESPAKNKRVLNDESFPIVDLNIDVNDNSLETYGARKYLCERAIEEFFPNKASHLRAGLIVGPYDTTYRFPYWVERFAEGGDVLVPGPKDKPLQFIDVDDLGRWAIKVALEKKSGIFNAVGPVQTLTMEEFVDIGVNSLGTAKSTKIHWVSDKVLQDHGVQPWMGLPLWIPGETHSFMNRINKKAIDAGLTIGNLENTFKKTLGWLRSERDAHPENWRSKAMTRDVERRILSV